MSNITKRVGFAELGMLATANTGLGTLPRPFGQRIFLLGTHVAGTTHISSIDGLVATLEDGQSLTLVRDPRNSYDEKAIAVLDGHGRRLGFVPVKDNEVISRLLDAGKKITAEISGLHYFENWHKIEIEIYFED